MVTEKCSRSFSFIYPLAQLMVWPASLTEHGLSLLNFRVYYSRLLLIYALGVACFLLHSSSQHSLTFIQFIVFSNHC